jgi:cytochrome P450
MEAMQTDDPASSGGAMNAGRPASLLPGPPGLPWLGNMLQMDAQRPHVTMRQWGEAYRPIFRFAIGGKQFVGLTDHAAIQQLLRDRPARVRRMRSIQEVIDEIAGTGLFSAEGEDWRRQRKLMAPAFNPASVQQYFPQVKFVTKRLSRLLHSRAQAGAPFEIQRDFMNYAVDVTTWLTTGCDVNTMETGGEEFQRDLEEAFPAIARRINAPFPYWRYVQLGRDRRLNEALTRLRGRVNHMVAARRERTPVKNLLDGDLLDALVQARDEDGEPLSEKEIFGNIITMLTAGEDTTAYSLAWTILFMTRAPEVQQRMRAEVERVLGGSAVVERFEQLEGLEFIEAVALEAMRLKPVAPALFLEANEDLLVLDTCIPRGMNIAALTSFDALAEENFTFAGEFRPERWLANERPETWNHNVRAFMPFGGGARVCPGRSLAMIEIKFVLAMICRQFQVQRYEAAGTLDERFVFSVAPANLHVTLRAE